MKYRSGEEIHAGDRVRHARSLAVVVAVMSRGEYTEAFPAEDWSHYGAGFILQDALGNVYMYDDADEDIELIARADDSA